MFVPVVDEFCPVEVPFLVGFNRWIAADIYRNHYSFLHSFFWCLLTFHLSARSTVNRSKKMINSPPLPLSPRPNERKESLKLFGYCVWNWRQIQTFTLDCNGFYFSIDRWVIKHLNIWPRVFFNWSQNPTFSTDSHVNLLISQVSNIWNKNS